MDRQIDGPTPLQRLDMSVSFADAGPEVSATSEATRAEAALGPSGRANESRLLPGADARSWMNSSSTYGRRSHVQRPDRRNVPRARMNRDAKILDPGCVSASASAQTERLDCHRGTRVGSRPDARPDQSNRRSCDGRILTRRSPEPGRAVAPAPAIRRNTSITRG